MDRVKKIKRKKSKGVSYIWQMVDRFTAFLYSLFIFGRIGDKMSNEDTYCRRSFLAQSFSGRNRMREKMASLGIASAMNKNIIIRAVSAVGRFLAHLKLNVYGTFFTFYGLTSALLHYIFMLINGQSITSAHNLDVIIMSAAITVCSVPLLFSSQSLTGAVASSRMMRKIVLDFFDIPEEKLKNEKQYGGKQCVFFAVILAVGLGVLAYLLTPWYMPVALLVVAALYLIFANPEAGVILTIASIPFLQYASATKAGLAVMITITAISYLCKLIQRRRAITLSPELTMALLFCAFILAGSVLTRGGAQVMWDAVSTVIIITGGFFLTYNLITSKKGIRICTGTLAGVLVVCSLIGIWDGFYYGIAHRISDPVSEHLSNISNVDVMAMFDGGEAFGILAVMVFPVLFTYAVRKKSVKRTVTMIIASGVILVAAWMCTRYEIAIALVIECLMFWLLYSHSSLTVMILAALPVSIAVILYPYAIAYWGWPNISMFLAEYMPTSMHSTAINTEAAGAILTMIFDGNILGIGAGESALQAIFPAYSSALTYSEAYGASVWLQILCWSGVFGLLSFVVFVGFLIKRSFRCFTRSHRSGNQGTGLALFCGIIVTLMLGTVTNVWINHGMMYVFWVLVGLLLSHIRESDSERAKREASFKQTAEGTDTEVIFYK